MALETATYISGLVTSNPLPSDPKSQGDDHLRLLKSTLRNTFPNISGAVSATHTELNYVAGVTSGIQSQLNAITTQLAAGISIDKVSAATASSTIGNGANQINWNWTLTGATGGGFNVSETSASTGGAGYQDLVRIGTLSGSTANPLSVSIGGTEALKVLNDGGVKIYGKPIDLLGGIGSPINITGGIGTSTKAGAVIITGGSGSTYAGGDLQLRGGPSSSGAGGDISLTPGTGGSSNGRINFVSSNVANGTVASTFTASSGPTGAATSIQGWLAIKVNGTARYIPFW